MQKSQSGYRYDLSDTFRNQVIYIWEKSVGFAPVTPNRNRALAIYEPGYPGSVLVLNHYGSVLKHYCEETGKIGLPGAASNPCLALANFFGEASTDDALDIIQAMMMFIPIAQANREFMGAVNPSLSYEEAVAKLNSRFAENSIGFRYENFQIVRIDSELLHSEAVEPAFRLLQLHGYDGALEEFQMAHKHFRAGPDRFDDCLTNCLKALESTLQSIIQFRKWELPGQPKFDNLFAEVRNKGAVRVLFREPPRRIEEVSASSRRNPQ